MECVAQGLRDEGFAAEAFFGKGDPAPLILELAGNLPADLIAMATHGRHGVGKLVLGSVADIVVRQSTIPVLLLRLPVVEEGRAA